MKDDIISYAYKQLLQNISKSPHIVVNKYIQNEQKNSNETNENDSGYEKNENNNNNNNNNN